MENEKLINNIIEEIKIVSQCKLDSFKDDQVVFESLDKFQKYLIKKLFLLKSTAKLFLPIELKDISRNLTRTQEFIEKIASNRDIKQKTTLLLQRLKKSLTSFFQTEIPKEIKEPIQLRQKKFYEEQQKLKNDSQLLDKLTQVKKEEKFNTVNRTFMSYVYPLDKYKETENWIISFLGTLRYHLEKAGVNPLLGGIDNTDGGNDIQSFMEKIKDSEAILIFCCESLLEKHNSTGYFSIQDEISKIKTKYKLAQINEDKATIIPILLNGYIDEAVPSFFIGYRCITEVSEQTYENFLKELIRHIIGTGVDNEDYNKIWKDLSEKVEKSLEQKKELTDNNNDNNNNNYNPSSSLPNPPIIWHPDTFDSSELGTELFIGRTQELEKLNTKLQENLICAITQYIVGTGGIGKTRFAKEYAYRNCKNYKIIWWIQSPKFEEGYIKLAEKINYIIDTEGSILGYKKNIEINASDPKKTIEKIIEILADHLSDWLLIFDDVENENAINTYLPKLRPGSKRHILITSLNQNWFKDKLIFPLEKLSPEFSFELLKSIIGRSLLEDEELAAKELCKEFDYLTLAIVQAGAFIKQTTNMTVREYLNYFVQQYEHLCGMEEKEKSLLKDHQNTVYTTFSITLNKLRENGNNHAVSLIGYAAYLAPISIPIESFKDHKSELSLEFHTATANLKKYSLVQEESDKKNIIFHTLVQKTANLWLVKENKAKDAAKKVIKYLLANFPFDWDNVSTFAKCRLMLEHVEFFINKIEKHGADQSSEFCELLYQVAAYYLHDKRNSKKALDYLMEIEKIEKNNNLTLSPVLLAKINNHWAFAYQQQIKQCNQESDQIETIENAKKYAEKVTCLESYLKTNIEEGTKKLIEWEVAFGYCILALTNLEEGNIARNKKDDKTARSSYDLAEGNYNKAMKIYEKTNKQLTNQCLRARNRLAGIYLANNKPDEAKKEFETTIEGWEKTENFNENPYVARTYISFGKYYLAIAKVNLEEANRCHSNALKILNRAYKENEKSQFAECNELKGDILNTEGQYSEAQKSYQEASNGFSKDSTEYKRCIEKISKIAQKSQTSTQIKESINQIFLSPLKKTNTDNSPNEKDMAQNNNNSNLN